MYREPFSAASVLLGATCGIHVGTGIANIWTRDAFAMVAGQLTLAEAYPDRFILGLGVSHARLIEGLRGHHYLRPLETMQRYLDAMDEADGAYRGTRPETPPLRVLAALGPKMLRLARDRAHGAHTYLVTPEHTAQARAVLGPDRLLIVEQAAVLDTSPEHARATGRRHVSRYLDLPNYTSNLLRLGFDEADVTERGSDRLVDALVAHHDVDRVVDRVRAHHEAGADHVCIQVFDRDPHGLPRQQWRELASALVGGVSPA